MNLCMELVGILYGYLFGGLEHLLFVYNPCLEWLWSSIEEKICIEKMLGFRGDAVHFF